MYWFLRLCVLTTTSFLVKFKHYYIFLGTHKVYWKIPDHKGWGGFWLPGPRFLDSSLYSALGNSCSEPARERGAYRAHQTWIQLLRVYRAWLYFDTSDTLPSLATKQPLIFSRYSRLVFLPLIFQYEKSAYSERARQQKGTQSAYNDHRAYD